MKAGIRRIQDATFVRKGYWANTIVRVSGREDAVSAASSPADEIGTSDFKLKVEKLNKLSAQTDTVEENQHCGDLRNIAAAVQNLPGHLRFGALVREVFDDFLDCNPTVQRDCLACIGREVKDQVEAISLKHLRELRNGVCDLCARAGVQVDAKTIDPIKGELVSSNI